MGNRRSLEAALAGLGRLHPRAIDLSLDRMLAKLKALGNPQDRLPPVFHVAGTNGKGSTIAFLRAFLEAAGYRCHVYTSPHLVRFNERIRIGGQLVSDDALLDLIDAAEAAAPDQPITQFEITTAIAFLAFAQSPADAALIEVGLGGRYDATNVFPRPCATGVTRISYDHRQFLGDDIGGIAGEKAGIIKAGVPAVIADQPDPTARFVLEEAARATGAISLPYGAAWRVGSAAGGFRYDGPRGTLDLPQPALAGRHQWMNAGTALTMIDAAGLFRIDEAAVRRGLATVEWPGRMQRLTRGPLPVLLPPNCELWLDGAHNDSGGEVLGVQAAEWRDRPLDLVFGVRADKKVAEILGPIAPFARALRAVAIPGDPASASAEEAAKAARAAGIADSAPADSPAAAVAALSASPGPRRILICGSLYLAGAVLAENG